MKFIELGALALAGTAGLATSGEAAAQGEPAATAATQADAPQQQAAPAPTGPPASIVPASPIDAQPAPACCLVPALTTVELEILDPASSRTSKIGEKIRIRAAEPVLVNGQVAIPKGAEGHAEVIQAAKARMMGKAGELTLGMPYLMVGGQRVGLKRLRYGRSSGHDATLETTIATAAIGVVGMVITGGSVDIASGTRANAVVTADTPIDPTKSEVQLGGQ